MLTLLSEPAVVPQCCTDHFKFAWILQTPVTGWLEAFAGHPRLGDSAALRAKFESTGTTFQHQSATEQSELQSTASDAIIDMLAARNQEYEAKYGHIFILCAKGKTAAEVLSAMQDRCVGCPACLLRPPLCLRVFLMTCCWMNFACSVIRSFVQDWH
jgi:OHCU decarboxylase